ncbi:hypothetical protein Q7689_26540 [Nocardiopsis tropica]|nr:hypothetical protein [Nocardiopsis tropica]
MYRSGGRGDSLVALRLRPLGPLHRPVAGLLRQGEAGGGGLLGWLSEVTGSVTGLLPGGAGDAWWFPVLLAVVLVALGRSAASKKPSARARRRLAAFRLAVAGSLFMLVVLLSTGLVALGSGVLIPLDGLLG